jgi:hypothetical protein
MNVTDIDHALPEVLLAMRWMFFGKWCFSGQKDGA